MLNLFPETSTLDQVTPREGRDCNLCSQPPCLEAGLGTLTGAGVEAGMTDASVMQAHCAIPTAQCPLS